MNINQSKSIDPIANMRNSNKLPKAVKDYYNQLALKGTRMIKKTPNKFIAARGKIVVGDEKIIRLTKEIKVKLKNRKRAKRVSK